MKFLVKIYYFLIIFLPKKLLLNKYLYTIFLLSKNTTTNDQVFTKIADLQSKSDTCWGPARPGKTKANLIYCRINSCVWS